jgi:deazaflavin-dependent oxidoreductase (nitroreductase family)
MGVEVRSMNTVLKKVMKTASAVTIPLYRRSGGRIGGTASGGIPVGLLTVRGRRTGEPRTTSVGYVEHVGGWLVVGSAGGMKEEPQWFRNLRKADRADLEIGRTRRTVAVRVLAGEERDRVWRDVVRARYPFFQGYVDKSGREMPIALLTPLAATE